MTLFVLPLFSGGGAERVMLNLLTGLYHRGYSVGIIVFNKKGPLLSLLPENVPVYNLKTNTLRYSIIPLLRKIRKLQPKVVFSTFGYINIVLLAMRYALPRRTSIWVREANLPSISLKNNPHPFLMRFAYGCLYRGADYVFCTSNRMRDEFIFDFSVPLSNICILPNPIDEKIIRSHAVPVKSNNTSGVHFVAAGRLTNQKGFDRLLRWFAKIRDKKAILTIFGVGVLLDDLKKISRTLEIEEQVVFAGYCNNPWQWYSGADAFLLSSRWEGMPNAALEALACGTSIIATAESGGIYEVSLEASDGSVIVANNGSQFIAAMKKVSVSDLLKPSLLPEKYKLDNVIDKFAELIDKL